MGVIPWSPLGGGWLSGRGRKEARAEELTSPRARRIPDRYDMSKPENQRKLDVADALARLADEAGMPLPVMAVAWVMNHPGVTAPIIGPRTMDQLTSQLPAMEVELGADLLDRIDEIVPPGVNVNPADAGYIPRSLGRRARRRVPRRRTSAV